MGPDDRTADRISGRPSLFALLVASALTLVLLDVDGAGSSVLDGFRGGARAALAPVEKAGAATLAPVGDVGAGLARGAGLAGENERLRAAAGEVRAVEARAEALERDNARLAEALGLAPVNGLPSINARVVSLPTGLPGSTFLIDRGSEAGIGADMPVLVRGVLVGRVTGVSGGQATVLPVTDPGAVVGVRLGAAGAVGLARGAGPGRSLPVDLLDPEADVVKGDLAVTSGLQHSRFPAGVPIGRVLRPGATPRLEPLADPSRLELVQVLNWQPSG